MKFLELSLVAIAVLGLCAAEGSIFERTFRTLHIEPPVSAPVSRARIATQWIEQKLDHFDERENATWKMRYMANDQYFEDEGPIFIYVGGEWEISPGQILGGHFHDMAKEHKGYLYYTEHRYYGKSHPTKDLSNENMKYLHVRQALADLAHFILTQKSTIPGLANSKVILAGGSYSATMVTWFKRLYPELATGCWASSAPLKAKADFFEYKKVTGQSIKLVSGDACYNRIQNGIAILEEMIDKKRGAEVKALLKICNNFDEYNDLDVWTLFSEISDIFAGVVQTHSDGRIQSVCKQIMKGEDDLSGLTGFILSIFGSDECNDVSYKTMITSLSETAWNGNIMRQWIYQTCNEYGWYQTSTAREQPFGKRFPLQFYVAICSDAFGNQFSNSKIQHNVQTTNTFFGGLEPEVSNVYFTHGQLDPWRAMGIQDSTEATIIPMHAHCKDFNSISPNDTPEMVKSKETIAELVREWVGGAAH